MVVSDAVVTGETTKPLKEMEPLPPLKVPVPRQLKRRTKTKVTQTSGQGHGMASPKHPEI